MRVLPNRIRTLYTCVKQLYHGASVLLWAVSGGGRIRATPWRSRGETGARGESRVLAHLAARATGLASTAQRYSPADRDTGALWYGRGTRTKLTSAPRCACAMPSRRHDAIIGSAHVRGISPNGLSAQSGAVPREPPGTLNGSTGETGCTSGGLYYRKMHAIAQHAASHDDSQRCD